MIEGILCSLVFAFFTLNDVVPLFRSKRWKMFSAYGVLVILSYVLLFLIMYDVEIPSPNVAIQKAVNAIFGQRN